MGGCYHSSLWVFHTICFTQDWKGSGQLTLQSSMTDRGNDQEKMQSLMLYNFQEKQELRESLATCLNLSICGNFVFVGYDSGHVDKFNIQSGIFRWDLIAQVYN